MPPHLAAEIAALPRLRVSELRAKFAVVFGESTPSHNKVWLVRRIAWRLQAQAEGDLSERAEDRGHVLLFEPTALEVHRQAAGWFWDQAIFDFVAGHLHLMAAPSLRTYRQAWELKRAGLDWRRAVLSRCLTGPALLVARLKADPVFTSEAARVRAFIAAGAGCRATYFHYAHKLRLVAGVPKMALTHTAPPADEAPTPDHFDDLRKRFGQLGNG